MTGSLRFRDSSVGYPDYAAADVRELVERYEPSVLWNDICWPARSAEIFSLLEHYFSIVPDGCVNDRWFPARDVSTILGRARVADVLESMARRQLASAGIVPPPVPFSQFRTPEYADLPGGMSARGR